MPEGYVGRAIKYASDEASAIKFLGTKPDRNGFFRLKRGGIGKIKSITKIADVPNPE
jgi:hypothetical protein